MQLAELPTARTRLLDNLGRIRREVGPVTPELSDALADHMRIRRGEVAEVVSFYSFLRLPLDSLRVCTGPVCACLGGHELLAVAQEVAPDGLPVVEVACLGHCEHAPVGTRGDTILPGLSRAVLEGAAPAPVTHFTNDGPSLGLSAPDAPASPPQLPPERVLAELEASGLVGLGGAGFPTWRKWEAVRREPGPRVVIVNADEGEPGTIKDRYIMELRPNLMLEGLLVAMEFAEAERGYIYLREEYATARARLLDAIAALGDLGGRTIELVVGAGSYICGEETAMLESMEGRRGMPRLRPPFPAQRGYLGAPTLIDNVETLAHIPAILRNGGDVVRRARSQRREGRPALVALRRGGEARLLRGGKRDHAARADRRARRRRDGGDRRDRARRRRERDRAAGRARHAADEGGARGVGRLGRLGRGAGLPGLVLAARAPHRDDAVLRRGVVPEVHALPDRHARAPPPRRRAHDVRARDELEAWLEALEQASICGLGQGAPIPVRVAMADAATGRSCCQ